MKKNDKGYTKDEAIRKIQTEMQHFTNEGFEDFTNRTMYNTGNGYTHKTKQTHDGGIDGDIYAYKKGVGPVHDVMQCKKYYTSGVSEKEMLDYVNREKFKEANERYYYTTGIFQEDARKIGEQNGVIMVDGKKLATTCVEKEIGCYNKNGKYYMQQDYLDRFKKKKD